MIKDIPLVVINHVYQTQEMFSKPVISGGTGVNYASNRSFIITRSTNKEDNEIAGYNFNITVDKSRYVREKSRIPITVSWEGGLKQWSGMYEIAEKLGYIITPSKGWRAVVLPKTTTQLAFLGKELFREGDFENGALWKEILSKTPLAADIKKAFQTTSTHLDNKEFDDIGAIDASKSDATVEKKPKK
jgi:hypothetical protein